MTSPRRPRSTARRVSRPVRTAAVLALGAGAALGLSGCSVTNPIQSQADYAPSDGVRVTVGDLIVQNLLVVSAGEGEPGNVSGAISNEGQDDARVGLALEDGTEIGSLTVEPGQNLLIGVDEALTAETTELRVDEVPAPPGAMIQVTITSDRGGATTTPVPVLDGTLEQYEHLLP